jgi:hypothetical protein
VAVDALVVRPGDVLLIRVSPSTSREQFDKFAALVKEGFAKRMAEPPEVMFIAAEQLGVVRASCHT